MRKVQFEITSGRCAEFLGLALQGADVNLVRVANVTDSGSGAVKFAHRYDEPLVKKLNEAPSSFVIAHTNYAGKIGGSHVLSPNPRLDFCRIANRFFSINSKPAIESTAIIGENVDLGDDVYVGHNVTIENDVKIGVGTKILHNVVISAQTIIGKNCLIKSGTIIGQKGFGFERDEDGVPVSFPHFGTVVIGDYVEIGALNTVVAGALTDTVIGNDVKTDDHVHIAHNVKIGQRSLITACTEISGSVVIGEQVWLGPNCSVIEAVKIDDHAFIGIGTVIRKPVEAGSTVAGNPAKVLRRN